MATIKIMTTPALRSITTTAMAAAAANNRLFIFTTKGQRLQHLSSTTKLPPKRVSQVGIIKPRNNNNNKPSLSSSSPAFTQEVKGGDSAAAAAESLAESSSTSDELPWNVKRNNFILASILFTFCTSVAWYSMNAVGQADNTNTRQLENDNEDDNNTDPLAALRIEAQAAQQAHNKQQQEAKEASVMLQQFDKGEFDPDRIDEDEEEEVDDAEKKKQGKSWWRWLKFW